MHKTYSIIPCCCLGTNITDQSMKWLWVELYALANYTDTDDLRRGQLRTTYTELSRRSGISEKQVRTRIDKLVTQHYLEKTKTNKGLILTIVNYDKYINGKGRRIRSITHKDSTEYRKPASKKGEKTADKELNTTTCFIEGSGKLGFNDDITKGNQNEEKSTPYNSMKEKRDVVVEKDNNSISLGDIIRNKQLNFKNEVLKTIELMDWKANLEIPEFKTAIVKFLQYYGERKDNKLLYESINGFRIEYQLRRWIDNEYALKNILQ